MLEILPGIRPDSTGERCDFLWLNAEAPGPVDPTCGGKSDVILNYGGTNEKHRCKEHAAYDFAIILYRNMGMQKSDLPREALELLVGFFEKYVAAIISGDERYNPIKPELGDLLVRNDVPISEGYEKEDQYLNTLMGYSGRVIEMDDKGNVDVIITVLPDDENGRGFGPGEEVGIKAVFLKEKYFRCIALSRKNR